MLLFNKNTLPREELIQCIYLRKPSILTLNAKISEVCFTDFSHIHSFYSTNELNHLWSWNDGNIPFKYKRRLCCQLFLWTSSTVNLLLFLVDSKICYIMNPKYNFVSHYEFQIHKQGRPLLKQYINSKWIKGYWSFYRLLILNRLLN